MPELQNVLDYLTVVMYIVNMEATQMGFQTIEADRKYTFFEVNGFTYRTDGNSVQGKDGNSWNTTYSLPIIKVAKAARKNEKKGKP